MTNLCRWWFPAVAWWAGRPILAVGSPAGGGFSNPFTTAAAPSPPPPPPVVPPGVRAEEIVGRWGLASYHREQDRPRTAVAAKSQCTQPYKIEPSPPGSVILFRHHNPQLQQIPLTHS